MRAHPAGGYKRTGSIRMIRGSAAARWRGRPQQRGGRPQVPGVYIWADMQAAGSRRRLAAVGAKRVAVSRLLGAQQISEQGRRAASAVDTW